MVISFKFIGKMLYDALTNKVGEYDIARIAGYSFAGLSSFVFLALAIYDTVVKQTFNYEGFTLGITGVSAVILAAAGGVRIKDKTENQDRSNDLPDENTK